MRIIRPQQLIAIKSGYQIGRDSRLGISVIAGVDLTEPTHFVTEAQIWDAWSKAPLSLSVLDAAEPKPFAEYLIAGHAGIGKPVQTLDISAHIGTLSRYWRAEGESTRDAMTLQPFLSVPLDHSSSWGGENVKENPLGRGGGHDNLNPLLMSLGINGMVQGHSPLAAPSPIPHEFQLRKQHIDNVASYMATKAYLETVHPGLPTNIDMRYFQMAASEQWLSSAEWPEVIPYELSGFRPDEQVISGVLPAVKARAFLRFNSNSEAIEVHLQRKTLWFFPDNNIALIIFTGNHPIAHLLDNSIESLIVGIDNAQQLRSQAHYQSVYEQRTDQNAPPFAFLCDPDLMPENMSLNIIQSMTDHPSSLRYENKMTPTQEAEAFYQKVYETLDAHKNSLDEEPANTEVNTIFAPENNNEMFTSSQLELSDNCFLNLSFAGEITGKKFIRCRFNLDDFSQSIFNQCNFEHCIFESVNFYQSTMNSVNFTDCIFIDATLNQAKIETCYFQRTNFERVYAINLKLKNTTITQCVFNDSDLSKSDFQSSIFDQGMLKTCDISEARFQQGEIKSCLFNQCQAESISCYQVAMSKNSHADGNWQKSHFDGCNIECLTVGLGANFSYALFTDCRVTKAGLKNTQMIGSQLLYSSFSETNFDQANLSESTIHSCDMAGIRLQDSILSHSYWDRSSLQQAVLYNADLRNTQFEKCNLASANLAMTLSNTETHYNGCLLEQVCWIPRRILTRVSQS